MCFEKVGLWLLKMWYTCYTSNTGSIYEYLKLNFCECFRWFYIIIHFWFCQISFLRYEFSHFPVLWTDFIEFEECSSDVPPSLFRVNFTWDSAFMGFLFDTLPALNKPSYRSCSVFMWIHLSLFVCQCLGLGFPQGIVRMNSPSVLTPNSNFPLASQLPPTGWSKELVLSRNRTSRKTRRLHL